LLRIKDIEMLKDFEALLLLPEGSKPTILLMARFTFLSPIGCLWQLAMSLV
jgi:hypothetical protein